MPPHRSARSSLFSGWPAAVAVAVLAACVAGVGGASGAPTASATEADGPGAVATASAKVVTYGAYRVEVPASWPVFDLAAAPSTCVRFDRNAVYLGEPSATQDCPVRAIGVADSLLIEPLTDPVATTVPFVTADAGTPVVVPTRAATTHRFVVDVPNAGVTVTATFGAESATVSGLLSRAQATGHNPPRAKATTGGRSPASPSPPPPSSPAPGAGLAPARATASGQLPTVPVPYSGHGFDACTAPPAGLQVGGKSTPSVMQAWKASSPYGAVGIYIGGANRGCSQNNLSAEWVQVVTKTGWSLIPIYVGLQAPTSSCVDCARLGPSGIVAQQQGVAAANDAVAQAQALGIGPSSPLFYDMEAYDNSASQKANVEATMAFLAAWTVTLHNAGYRSGVYSSAASGIADLVSRAGTTFAEPDELWIARWNGVYTTSDPVVPANLWPHQRLVQYTGGVNETYGGFTLNIDHDAIDAPLAAAGAGPYVQRTYQNLLGRSADSAGFRYWSGYVDFGGSLSSFTGSLAGSWEFAQHLVVGDYQEILGRSPDADGLTLWAFTFAASGHNDRVLAHLAASTEFWSDAGRTATGFVQHLYETVLGRAPGPSELSYWVGTLARGATTYDVALTVLNSPEGVSDVVSPSYQHLVGAAPDPGGLVYWSAQLQRSGDPRPLWIALAASPAAYHLA